MRIKIELEVDVPDIMHTESELEEYLEYSYGERGSIRQGNPFYETGDPEIVNGTFFWDIK